jgi:hypothetical protein
MTHIRFIAPAKSRRKAGEKDPCGVPQSSSRSAQLPGNANTQIVELLATGKSISGVSIGNVIACAEP